MKMRFASLAVLLLGAMLFSGCTQTGSKSGSVPSSSGPIATSSTIGVPPSSDVPSGVDPLATPGAEKCNFFFVGSSTTTGIGASSDANRYYNQCFKDLGWKRGLISFGAWGQSGALLPLLNGMAKERADNHLVKGKVNVLILQAFVNDTQQFPSVSTIVAETKKFCASRKRAGWNRIILIIPCYPKGPGLQVSNRQMPHLIQELLAEPGFLDGTYADGFIHWDKVPELKYPGHPPIFLGDGVHFNDAGHALAGRVTALGLAAWLQAHPGGQKASNVR